MPVPLFTIGYRSAAPAGRMGWLVRRLREADVGLLVDTRHSPCAANPSPASRYGPQPWNLQSAGAGIEPALSAAGIGYLWLVELGNPQKNDPAMTVLRAHLAEPGEHRPVHRGLAVLGGLLRAGRRCCLMCACEDAAKCHRTVVGQAAVERFVGLDLELRHL